MSLSRIVQALWNLSNYNLETVTFICHLDKNGCKLDQKRFNKKMKKDVCLLMALKKKIQGRCSAHSVTKNKQKNNSLKTDKYMTAIPT